MARYDKKTIHSQKRKYRQSLAWGIKIDARRCDKNKHSQEGRYRKPAKNNRRAVKTDSYHHRLKRVVRVRD